MEQEKKQAVALMRYSAIAPLITGTQEDYGSLSTFVPFRQRESRRRTVPSGTILREPWKNGTFLTGNPVLMPWCPPDGLTVA